MSHTIHAFEYLAAPEKYPPAPMCALFGDEPFLKNLVRRKLRTVILAGDDDAPYATFDGETAEWRDLMDELATVSMFGGGQRLALVHDADDFVTRFRVELEKYAEKPHRSGVLVLDVSLWASNTRLYKAVHQSGLQIECRLPEKKTGSRKSLDEGALTRWIVAWAKAQHQAQLSQAAAAQLLERVGPQLGFLDQELAKLALYAGVNGKITPELVQNHAGGWRTRTTWELIDQALAGNTAEALRQLDRLLLAGENPVALFGQISWSLRRFNAATRIYERAERAGQRPSLLASLQAAGVNDWPQGALAAAEQQLKQLTRQRAGKLYRWLLEADLALKLEHSQKDRARFVLERLFARLSQQVSPKLTAPRAAGAR